MRIFKATEANVGRRLSEPDETTKSRRVTKTLRGSQGAHSLPRGTEVKFDAFDMTDRAKRAIGLSSSVRYIGRITVARPDQEPQVLYHEVPQPQDGRVTPAKIGLNGLAAYLNDPVAAIEASCALGAEVQRDREQYNEFLSSLDISGANRAVEMMRPR